MTELQQANLIKEAHALLDQLEHTIKAMFEAAESVSFQQKKAA